MTIKTLDKEITGTGDVSGFKFTFLDSTERAYAYECDDSGIIYYEVFLKHKTALCIDFEKRIYSETEFKEIYPKTRDFGNWAWTFRTLEEAMIKLGEL